MTQRWHDRFLHDRRTIRGLIGQQVQSQVSFLGYTDAFWVLMLISLAAVPQALTLQLALQYRGRGALSV